MLPIGLSLEICQSWPQKSNISAAAGCLHETQACTLHLNGRDISTTYYPPWPKLYLSFTARVGSFAFPVTKDIVLTLKGIGKIGKDVDVRRFHSIQSIYFFIDSVFLSEEQEYLYPLARGESCHDACGSEHRHLFHRQNRCAHAQNKFSFPWPPNPVWFSNLQPISLWKFNMLVCDSHSALLMYLSI